MPLAYFAELTMVNLWHPVNQNALIHHEVVVSIRVDKRLVSVEVVGDESVNIGV